jgi:hypothetical protein
MGRPAENICTLTLRIIVYYISSRHEGRERPNTARAA